MIHPLKVRRFSLLQKIFAATVLLLIAKAVALRHHLIINDSPRAFGAQAAFDQDDQATLDDEFDTLARDGESSATDAQ